MMLAYAQANSDDELTVRSVYGDDQAKLRRWQAQNNGNSNNNNKESTQFETC